MAFHPCGSSYEQTDLVFYGKKLVTFIAMERLFVVCLYMCSHTIKSGEEILPALFTAKLLLHAVLF